MAWRNIFLGLLAVLFIVIITEMRLGQMDIFTKLISISAVLGTILAICFEDEIEKHREEAEK